MQLIPLEQLPSQTFSVVLDGQYCTISLYWRQTRLYLDLQVGSNIVCQGAICQNRTEILQSRSPLFSGGLYFVDQQSDSAPMWEDLDNGATDSTGRWVLVYLSAGETVPEFFIS